MVLTGCYSIQNLARGQLATQSSTYDGAEAWRAVDGITRYDTSRGLTAGGCAGTDGHDRPDNWWMVDLGQLYAIRYLVIFSRIGWSKSAFIIKCLIFKFPTFTQLLDLLIITLSNHTHVFR